MVHLLLAAVLCADPSSAAVALTEGTVVAITDGDTLTVLDSANRQHKIRLHGIDAPERKQPFGTASKKRLGELTAGKKVSVETRGQDRYQRTIGVVTADGANVNLRMVQEGMAWHFVRYAPNDKALATAEADARQAKRGLWSQEAVAPWEWRQVKRPMGGM